MNDLANNVQLVMLADPISLSADTYSLYVDTAGMVGVGFEVQGFPSTSDASNFFTPILYGTNSTAPQTFSEYTVCAAAELEGGLFTASKQQVAGFVQFRSLKQHLYRYYCVFLDETLTAVAILSVVAHCQFGDQPSDSHTAPTTGAVT